MDFSRIKKLFIVEQEEESKKPEPQKQKEKTGNENIQVVDATKRSGKNIEMPQTKSETEVTPKAQLNDKILESLSIAIQNSDLPGEDYLEFIGAVQSLKDLPLTDELKYRTAYSTLSTKGLTYNKIFESADYYVKVLENEHKKFYEALNQRSNSVLTQNRGDIEKLKAENMNRAKMIEKLSAEISETQDKIASLETSIVEAETKLKTTEQEFVATYQYMVEKIKSNISKVKQFIQI
jgi:hypothetical protein